MAWTPQGATASSRCLARKVSNAQVAVLYPKNKIRDITDVIFSSMRKLVLGSFFGLYNCVKRKSSIFFLSFEELGKICPASVADMNENPQESCFLLLHVHKIKK